MLAQAMIAVLKKITIKNKMKYRRNTAITHSHGVVSREGNPKNQNPTKNDNRIITQEKKDRIGKSIISLSFRSTPRLVFISCQLVPNFPMKTGKRILNN
jgi:hypothetical protein